MYEQSQASKLPYPDNLKSDLAWSPFSKDEIDMGRVDAIIDSGLLTQREKDIILKSYMVKMPRKELGEIYGVTPERIRQLTNIGLAKIRRGLKSGTTA